MSNRIKCLDCAFANWKRTKSGGLHPSGGGRCTWSDTVEIKIPASMYFIGMVNAKPTGGFISRKPSKFGGDILDCPTFKPIDSNP